MKPVTDLPEAIRRNLKGVLFDIDDTLTTDGRLTAEAYAALEKLHVAGLTVIPVTGRPAGWCDHIARMWPIDGVVGENGAFYFRYQRKARYLLKRYVDEASVRAEHRLRLDSLRERILATVPGCAVASDQNYRETDLAIDYREDVAPLSADAVAHVVALFEAAGATAKVSSIHINGWFGDYDKLSMTRRLFAEQLYTDLEAKKDRFVFVGDSPNDAPMFAFFPHSVAVANIADFAGRLEAEPAYVTENRGGAGFGELADTLLSPN